MFKLKLKQHGSPAIVLDVFVPKRKHPVGPRVNERIGNPPDLIE